MLWFGSNKNGGHDKPKSGELGHVHGPVIIGHNGVKHSIDRYESHNSEQYMARTTKVVKYRRFPGMADEEYIPSRTEEYGRFNSPPSKDHHRTTQSHGKSGNLNFDTDLTDDDDEEEDLSVNNTNGTRPNNTKEREYHNDEKNKRYGFTKEGFRPNHLKDQEDYYERRYGMGAPGAGPGLYAENKYSGGTIDSKEAARRYNGVLLTN